ncbi:GNAT family N-acetyltransferase [Actinoplanes sp. NPDC051513]|uniref:GNAT family N-acetyltransferase n=1 Tax=Actinoplanes sp. NPDC051513 TaxID=3363908 RepID=UPI0037A0CF89
MATTIRAAAPADLGRVVQIEQAAFGATAFPYSVFRRHLDLSGKLFAVAEDTPGVVGFLLAARSVSPEVVWFLDLAVERSFRNRRIGRGLLSHAVTQCRSLGVSRIRGTVKPDNIPSQRVLHALGFAEIAYDPAYFGTGYPRRIVELDLR